jgi:DNA-binding FrmR family transcriptional regulator
MPDAPPDRCIRLIRHLSRIQGQIEALKGYLEDKRSCEDVAHLTRSILTSFASVRASILEEMLCEELGDALPPRKAERLASLVALYKS